MRLHPAIRRTATIMDALSRPRPLDRRRAVQRFRRTGAGRRRRNRRDRRAPIWRELPVRDRAHRRPRDRGDREGAVAGGDELRGPRETVGWARSASSLRAHADRQQVGTLRFAYPVLLITTGQKPLPL